MFSSKAVLYRDRGMIGLCNVNDVWRGDGRCGICDK